MSCDDDEGYLILSSTRNLTPRCKYYIIFQAYRGKDKILRLLGQGTFGKVVEAFDRTTKQHVAIKIIKSIQKYRDASKMEIKTLQTLEQHDPDCTKYVFNTNHKKTLYTFAGLFQLQKPYLHGI